MCQGCSPKMQQKKKKEIKKATSGLSIWSDFLSGWGRNSSPQCRTSLAVRAGNLHSSSHHQQQSDNPAPLRPPDLSLTLLIQLDHSEQPTDLFLTVPGGLAVRIWHFQTCLHTRVWRTFNQAPCKFFFFFFFSFKGCPCSLWTFLGSGSNQSCSCGLHHSNAGSELHL